MTRLLAFLMLLPAIGVAKPVSEASPEGDVPRFSMIAEGLYRGGQPTTAGFLFLKEKGVKTIINLRAEDNTESKIVQALGMNYVQIPVDQVRPWTRLSPDSIAKYFELVNNPENYPIFFHCWRGADRTGALAALYRIAVQGWDAGKAYDEAREIGMRWYFAGLRSQIYRFHPPNNVADLQPAMKGLNEEETPPK